MKLLGRMTAILLSLSFQILCAEARSATAPVSSSVRIRHLQALEHALEGNNVLAMAILKPLLNQPMSADEHDRVLLTTARVQYQAGQDAAALEYYNQIRKGGPTWFEALEERSSALMRMGRPQEAMASLKTVLTPIFKDRVSSEPYYILALAQLRVCDFRGVFRTIDLFKNRFRDRVKNWETEKASNDNSRQQLAETQQTIQKLNLLEAEAIQRLYIDESGKPMSGKVPAIAKGADQLSFPIDPETEVKEVWVDEVDDYKVSVKGCPSASTVTPAPTQASNRPVKSMKKERSL
jgi:tetratricopeptide (TPR) repeat protein